MSIKDLTKAFEKSLTLKDNESLDAKLITSAQKNLSDIQKAEEHQWITVSARFPEGLDKLNETLKNRTYLLDTQEPSVADAVVVARVMSLVKDWKKDEIIKYRHVARWVDQIQNQLDVKEKIPIDLSLEAPRELKEKKAKGDGKDDKSKEKKEKTKEKKEKKTESNEDKSKGAKSPEELEALRAAKKEKKEKAKKDKPAQAPKETVAPNPGMIDLRVGWIEKAVKHPDADSLYVSTIHMGDEEGPRTVCSGLVKYVSLEDMQDRKVVVVANLKPVSMRGIKSSAMVLCASTEETVEFVNPPEGSKAGDKIFFESYDNTPEPLLNPKKKIWEAVQPGFTTNNELEVIYKKEGEKDRKLINKNGELCHVTSLIGAQVR